MPLESAPPPDLPAPLPVALPARPPTGRRDVREVPPSPAGTPGGNPPAAAGSIPPVEPVEPVAGPSPADQQRIRRRIALAGAVLVLVVLVGGGAGVWLTRPRFLDTGVVANRLGSELSSRLGTPVRVRCAGTPRRRTGETFQCTASTSRGSEQAVVVTVLDSAGRYRWRLAGPL